VSEFYYQGVIDGMTELLEQLREVTGARGYLDGDSIGERHFHDLMGARRIRPQLLLRPGTTAELSRILALCHAANQPVAVQGGMTGLVSAAAPQQGEIAISMERMKQVIEIDPFTATITVEAGLPLQTLQETAAEHGLLFPLDLGSRGSCTIGGNLSTNAGGNRVIRYGMTRDLVLGLEVVLADGTVLEGLSKLRKNNTGYDLKQLFIGSEGTLGVITKAVLKLMPQPGTQDVAVCGVNGFEKVAELLLHAQKTLGGNLTGFEVIWRNTYELICQHATKVKAPLPVDYDFYVLIESMGSGGKGDRTGFEDMLGAALDLGLVSDAVLSNSAAERDALWQVRDAAAGVAAGIGFMHNYDISLNVSDMDYFGTEVEKRLRSHWPDAILGLFGHVGDGNLHIIIHVGEQTRALHQAIDDVIYGLIRELGGSVSAEHGIGLMKKSYLDYSRSAQEIQLMKTLKQALDPKGILSPGRIFD
jgi:FAD/FMN-containing dehydrogenase